MYLKIKFPKYKALRLLKWWVLLGADKECDSIGKHKQIWDDVVLPTFNTGDASLIPTNEELDRQQPMFAEAGIGGSSSSSGLPR